MTPEEKAKELINKFIAHASWGRDSDDEEWANSSAKQCAIICVEQIMPCTWKLSTYKKNGYISVAEETTTEYWQEVLSCLQNS